MFTLANNVATFVVDRTGVTGSSGVYTITYDAELYKSTRKLLEEGYTVFFKVVLKNSAKVNAKAEYFRAYLDDVGTKIYFLPDAELSNAGVFKFTLLDIPAQVKTNKSDIAELDNRVDSLEEEALDYPVIGEVMPQQILQDDETYTFDEGDYNGFWYLFYPSNGNRQSCLCVGANPVLVAVITNDGTVANFRATSNNRRQTIENLTGEQLTIKVIGINDKGKW